MRIIYFERIDTTAANIATHKKLVFNKRLRPKDDIKTEGMPFLNLCRKGIFFLPKKNSATNCVIRLVIKYVAYNQLSLFQCK